MTLKTNVGRVVWHDLMTNDVPKAMHFYAELFGWTYQIEHSSDFVWKSGEGDYPLIFANGEAHGGLVEIKKDLPSHWVAYVEVENVDAVTANAKTIGATISRNPFDVPGVGRSAVIRDPQGAIICPFMPTHNLPPPSGTFLWNELITDDVAASVIFYTKLFGWKAKDGNVEQMKGYTVFKSADEVDSITGAMHHSFAKGRSAAWVPYLSTKLIDETFAKAIALGAKVQIEVTDVPNEGRFAILKDPTGAEFALFTPIKLID